MIYNFILEIIFFGCLAILVYMIARGIPRISEEEHMGRFERLVANIPFDRIDEAINMFVEKALRKAKIIVLKIDNLLTRSLNKVRPNGTDKD